MKLISSKDNPQYKHWYKVAQGKVKQEVLLEGEHLCEMWLAKVGQPEQAIVRYEGNSDEQGTGFNQSLHGLKDLDLHRITALSPSLFQQLNSVPSPQSIVFHVKVPSVDQLPMPKKSAVFLDRIQDPGNLGTIIRTCAAAGIESIYLSPGCVNPWSSKVLRSAQGAHFMVELYTQVEPQAFFAQNTLPVYVTQLSQRAQSLYQVSLPEHIVWVFGNEGQGVSDELSVLADTHIFIPQSELVESLNVGVACGVALFEQRRQLLTRES